MATGRGIEHQIDGEDRSDRRENARDDSNGARSPSASIASKNAFSTSGKKQRQRERHLAAHHHRPEPNPVLEGPVGAAPYTDDFDRVRTPSGRRGGQAPGGRFRGTGPRPAASA